MNMYHARVLQFPCYQPMHGNALGGIMRFVSSKNPISVASLKRRSHGAVVVRHCAGDDVKFVRVHGGWEIAGLSEVVTSAAVAAECNRAVGCKESWAKVY